MIIYFKIKKKSRLCKSKFSQRIFFLSEDLYEESNDFGTFVSTNLVNFCIGNHSLGQPLCV